MKSMKSMKQVLELMLLNTTMMGHAHMHTIICIICHVSYALSVAILAQDSRVGYKHKIFALSCAQTSVVIRICVNVRCSAVAWPASLADIA